MDSPRGLKPLEVGIRLALHTDPQRQCGGRYALLPLAFRAIQGIYRRPALPCSQCQRR